MVSFPFRLNLLERTEGGDVIIRAAGSTKGMVGFVKSYPLIGVFMAAKVSRTLAVSVSEGVIEDCVGVATDEVLESCLD